MSRFRKLSHTIWHCQYHIIWVPKYRLRILTGNVAEEVERCIRGFAEQQSAEIVELNVQIDHVHLLALVPPKKSISEFVGTVKGRTAIRVFNRFRHLKTKPYWGKSFLGSRILCGYGWLGCRKDSQVRQIPGRTRETSRKVKVNILWG